MNIRDILTIEIRQSPKRPFAFGFDVSMSCFLSRRIRFRSVVLLNKEIIP